ncbi:restriction endonuclease subunit S [Sphingobacterium sp. UDSM-2020]|uniref:restriction endonuclease subunit S n=1 Tax=Sphingobacterium sp. UDSM-2020 TaxID=2795738 RepID=UPI0019350775|nr:restriction endonuclease subunit S [Sphingobacterium sp. UDSM-2020]QQD13742.1 restriction endonuclease subunit S [Sphingobacterium sp. UDSM-2020]
MWEKVKLGELVKINKGKKHTPSDSGEFRYINIEDLHNPSNSVFTNEKGTFVNKNDVIIAWDGANAGKVGIRLEGVIGSTLAKLGLSKNSVSSDYLYWFLNSKNEVIKSQRTGATIPHVNGSALRDLEITLPPLHIQEKVAEILDKADELRRKDKNLQSKYDELAQAIFIDMFGDPVRNEKGWDKALLKEFYKNGVKCGPFGSALKKEEFKQNGVPVWNMDNIQSFEFLDLPSLFVSEEKYISLKQYEVLNGDIIISRAGTVGKMCVVDSTFKKSLLSTNLIKLSLDDCMLKSLFFVCLMKFFSKRLGRLKTGGEEGFTHMNTGVLNNLEIYVPPIAIQEEFAKKIELINQLKAQTNAEKSEELFQSLLQKAFKGELVS